MLRCLDIRHPSLACVSPRYDKLKWYVEWMLGIVKLRSRNKSFMSANECALLTVPSLKLCTFCDFGFTFAWSIHEYVIYVQDGPTLSLTDDVASPGGAERVGGYHPSTLSKTVNSSKNQKRGYKLEILGQRADRATLPSKKDPGTRCMRKGQGSLDLVLSH